MKKITYRFSGQNEVATFVGKSVRVKDEGKSKVKKESQLYLGKVINKEKNIFWNRKDGFFIFDPLTETKITPSEEDLTISNQLEPDGRKKRPPVIVDFGDAYFLDSLIKGIGYDQIINSILSKNKDSLYLLLAYSILDGGPASYAYKWAETSFASLLYSNANIRSQRISDLLKILGDPKTKRIFIMNHINYIKKHSFKDTCVIIDSTGLPNKCDLTVTKLSNHNGDVNLECRLIVVTQRITGLPIYFEIMEGNIVDVSTLQRIVNTLEQYDLKVSYCIGDAAYSSPNNINFCKENNIGFMTRVNPFYGKYRKLIDNNIKDLNQKGTKVRYNGRILNILKIQVNESNKDNTGEGGTTKESINTEWLYLCRDIESYHRKSQHIITTKAQELDNEELDKLIEKAGVFAITSSQDLECAEILPEYYARQQVEQYFDYAKNYTNFLPIRNFNEEAFQGHMLMSFIATFILVLIKNRLGVMDEPWIAVPPESEGEKRQSQQLITDKNNKKRKIKGILEEQKTYSNVRKMPLTEIMKDLRGQKADVYSKCIIPAIGNKIIRDIYKSFGIGEIESVRRTGKKLVYKYKDNTKSTISSKKVFAKKAFPTEEDIKISKLKRKEEKARADQEEIQKLKEEILQKNPKAINRIEKTKTIKRKRGRPKGSKNKRKTEEVGRKRTLKATLQTRSEKVKVKAELLETK